MYDELIARIRYHIRKADFMGLKEYESNRLLDEAADAIEELQVVVDGLTAQTNMVFEKTEGRTVIKFEPKWIPVTERLPDNQCDVLCDDEGRVVVGYYTDEKVGWHDLHSYKIYPTHWMPLPQPPKEE